MEVISPTLTFYLRGAELGDELVDLLSVLVGELVRRGRRLLQAARRGPGAAAARHPAPAALLLLLPLPLPLLPDLSDNNIRL